MNASEEAPKRLDNMVNFVLVAVSSKLSCETASRQLSTVTRSIVVSNVTVWICLLVYVKRLPQNLKRSRLTKFGMFCLQLLPESLLFLYQSQPSIGQSKEHQYYKGRHHGVRCDPSRGVRKRG
mmetsp:Transcript_4142/g.11298  ORF Transcript_4142/g.11298 Transcript_4142/m.11298 type:complete len:123 (+) Transcript_4142:1633-2001(+)